jgi:hypothetical protein
MPACPLTPRQACPLTPHVLVPRVLLRVRHLLVRLALACTVSLDLTCSVLDAGNPCLPPPLLQVFHPHLNRSLPNSLVGTRDRAYHFVRDRELPDDGRTSPARAPAAPLCAAPAHHPGKHMQEAYPNTVQYGAPSYACGSSTTGAAAGVRLARWRRRLAVRHGDARCFNSVYPAGFVARRPPPVCYTEEPECRADPMCHTCMNQRSPFVPHRRLVGRTLQLQLLLL